MIFYGVATLWLVFGTNFTSVYTTFFLYRRVLWQAFMDANCYNIITDGNCQYRALAKQLTNDPNQHSNLRSIIVKFAAHNVELFKWWVTSTPSETVQKSPEERLKEHLNTASKLGSWGTQLELVAAATLFHVDIYVATDSLVKGECRWTKFTPLKGNVQIPKDVKESTFQKSEECKSWIEITQS